MNESEQKQKKSHLMNWMHPLEKNFYTCARKPPMAGPKINPIPRDVLT